MKIRKKIILYFSTIIIGLTGLFFIFIYTLFAEYRQEEFQQRLKNQTATTLRFLAEVRDIDRDILQTMDRFTINNLYQEKILLFDRNKSVIYSSIDDTKIHFSKQILEQLSEQTPWVESMEDDYDVVGVFMSFENNSYYGITKAHDKFGFSKLNYLRNVLVFTFLILSMVIILITFYLSHQISSPLNKMALEINSIKFDTGNTLITVPNTKDEIHLLAQQFNKLMTRMNNAFAFQKHAVNHISHELKTPIAVLVSNFEKLENEQNPEIIRRLIKTQKENTKNLGDIINALLEIAKIESGNPSSREQIRLDDLIYDIVDELNKIFPGFGFDIELRGEIENENKLITLGNKRLLKSAFMNLMINCIHYSEENRATISINSIGKTLEINFFNTGNVIKADEKQFMFQHFFRGKNSHGKPGFGLGLVLVHKILVLHRGSIVYNSPDERTNVVTVSLPLK